MRQIIAETDDGVVFRKKREDFGLAFKDINYSQKPRLDPNSSFGTVTFELDNSVQII